MEDFIKVALVTDLTPGKGHIFELNDLKVALFNLDGKFYAINNTCCHRGGPLGDGEVEGEVVTCPLHSWKYDVTNGQCTTNPSAKVASYEVKVDGQDVLVKI
jgi:nitrite reductase (NADH) small subunit